MVGRNWVRIVVAVSLSIAFTSGSAYADSTNVELIIDASGSMKQRMEGKTKMAIAKQVMLDLAADLPADAQVAVRTYGNHRKDDCSDVSLLTSFGKNDPNRYRDQVNALTPVGKTPISASLEAAGRDFAGKEGQHNVIIFVSDGEETCEGDPCAAAKALHEAGVRLTVNVIGFDVGAKERKQLECIAQVSGGKYYNAANASEFKVAASEVKKDIAEPEETAVTDGYLLAPKQGGELLFAPDPSWANMVNGSGKTVVVDEGYEGIFGFKDGQAATFSKFEIRIPGRAPDNIKDFELFVANDSPTGPFRSLGTFTAYNGRAMKSEYQEFAFPETTAKYFKVKFLTYAEGLASNMSIHGIRLVGNLPAPSSTRKGASASKPAVSEVNLLAPEQGGKLMVAKEPNWANMVGGNHQSVVVRPGDEVVFQFKAGQPAIFSKFEVKIPEKAPWNLGEFELLAGDDSPAGKFKSLGTFKTYNGLALASPYQKFTFSETTARYFKVRFLTYSEGLASTITIHEIRLLGRIAKPSNPS